MSMYALQTCQNTQGLHLLQLNPVCDSAKLSPAGQKDPAQAQALPLSRCRAGLGSQNLYGSS